MEKIYFYLKEFWGIPAFIILACIFGLHHAILYTFGYILGEVMYQASQAFKRYTPTKIFIDSADIASIQGGDFKINNGTMNIPTANITNK